MPRVQGEETAVQEAVLPEELKNLYARSAVLMDAESMRVLVSKEGDVMRPMASTTKIMTCILALEEGNLDDVVTASGEAAAQPKVHLGMTSGETFVLRDLLYSLMLESHNDSAVAVAEHIAGSVPEFAKLMNQKAKEIGCENAHFVSPNGLDDRDEEGVHSISAADLARIMSYCIAKSPKAEEFLTITQTKSYSFSDAEGKRNFSCVNHNLFLDMMEGAISGKTGFTGDAGYCYVGALKRDGRTFVVALLACGWPNNKNYKWADTKALMNYGLEHYQYRDVWQAPKLCSIPVADGVPENGGLFEEAEAGVKIGTEDTELLVLLSDTEEVSVEIEGKEYLEAPVKKGTVVGKVVYRLEGRVLREYQIVTEEAVAKKEFTWLVKKLWDEYLGFQWIG